MDFLFLESRIHLHLDLRPSQIPKQIPSQIPIPTQVTIPIPSPIPSLNPDLNRHHRLSPHLLHLHHHLNLRLSPHLDLITRKNFQLAQNKKEEKKK
jgi:hypothetical protein